MQALQLTVVATIGLITRTAAALMITMAVIIITGLMIIMVLLTIGRFVQSPSLEAVVKKRL